MLSSAQTEADIRAHQELLAQIEQEKMEAKAAELNSINSKIGNEKKKKASRLRDRLAKRKKKAQQQGGGSQIDEVVRSLCQTACRLRGKGRTHLLATLA